MALDNLGRYEIIEELGRGSMGVVYKARDPLLDRILALKTVALDLSAEEATAFEQRFYREARSAGRLNHPNIVTVHDVGKTDSMAYIAMEFLQGRSLREILDSGVVLPVEKIVDIAAQVADGLAFAHAGGVVHRDIKPPNIMVLDSGAVKITDFGIALLPTGSRTLAGTVFGSPKYMSPEQIVGRPVDGRADIFALGAVLYEMLTGFAPFFGGDLEAVLYQVINTMPAAPSSRNRSLPAAFDYIVAKALAKHPDDRYGDARTFAADLHGFGELRTTVES
ncbi:MAG: serine/threonine-protein kinase, partial [Acidobacteriota bacterium]